MTRDDFLSAIRKSEGFKPQAAWDYKQHSNGYGTKAQYPGEVIDQSEAERRMQSEADKARSIVDKFAPNADEGTKNALSSLTYNAGDAWTRSGLGQAIQAGDMAKARDLFLQYNTAGGEFNQGLANRRASEVAWMGAPADATQPFAPGSPAQPQQASGLPTPQTTPETSPAASFGAIPDEWKAVIARAVGAEPQAPAQQSAAATQFGAFSGSGDEKMTREEYDQQRQDEAGMRLPAPARHRIDLGKLRSVLASRGSALGRA